MTSHWKLISWQRKNNPLSVVARSTTMVFALRSYSMTHAAHSTVVPPKRIGRVTPCQVAASPLLPHEDPLTATLGTNIARPTHIKLCKHVSNVHPMRTKWKPLRPRENYACVRTRLKINLVGGIGGDQRDHSVTNKNAKKNHKSPRNFSIPSTRTITPWCKPAVFLYLFFLDMILSVCNSFYALSCTTFSHPLVFMAMVCWLFGPWCVTWI